VSFHNWISLIVLFLLVDLGFYVEHRCSHRIRFSLGFAQRPPL
jgi:sterol desaturase/sphingolipid hydroxylase (fatty acid hydroxylase superfamily)